MSEEAPLRARTAPSERAESRQPPMPAALQASETRFRRLFESARDGILILDASTGAVIAVNPFLTTLLGYSEQDVLGKTLWELGPFKDTKVSRAAFLELQEEKYIRYDDLPLETRDGRSVAVEFISNVYVEGSSHVIQCNIRDITERKRAEEAGGRLVEILEATPDLVGIADLEGRLVYLNRGGRQMVGVADGADSAGYNIRRFYDEAHGERVEADAIPTAMRDGVWRGDTEITALDGRVTPVSQVILAHRSADGTVAFTSTIARDIMERKQADKSHRLQSAALHAAADGIVITDRAGTIEWVNPGFTRVSGYTAEEAVGRHHRDLVRSGTHDRAFFRNLWETILAGRTWRGEVVNRRKDGQLYTVEQSITPIAESSGAITHFVAIQQDITERLRLETQLRQAQKMESVGQLTSGIAHDFNNLLTVINGMSDLVLTQLKVDDPLRADVREIQLAGERAATLTRQLLAFSRQQIVEPRVLDLSTVIAGLTGLFHRLLGEKIELVTVVLPGVGRVKADPGLVEQVITNLAVNARDAMPQGGRLTIEVEDVTIDEASAHQSGEAVPPGLYVCLALSDSGVGMDEATRARVFEPFFTTKAPGLGTGLGLSTVYGIVKQSQGFVRVYSEVDRGTTFKVYLPRVTDAIADARPMAPPMTSRARAGTILVVEDNAGLRRLATRLLGAAGYTVLEAADGDAAFRLLSEREGPVDLLLTDVVMPGLSGRHLSERFAHTRPAMKVLYMSGYTSDTIVRHGVLEATMPFLNKPFTAAALLRKVEEVLDS